MHVQNHMVLIPTWYHRLFHTFLGLNGISLSIWLVRLRLVASFQLRECLTSTQLALRNKTFECIWGRLQMGRRTISTRHDNQQSNEVNYTELLDTCQEATQAAGLIWGKWEHISPSQWITWMKQRAGVHQIFFAGVCSFCPFIDIW